VLVGFAQTDITPPVGSLIPGGFRRVVSTGVHDPLHATAAVLDDGERLVAIISVDALSVKSSLVAEARRQIQKACNIPPENVLIAATHTHTGGPIADVFESEADPNYCAFVASQIARAVEQGMETRRPAFVGIGVGTASGLAFNRRFVMRNGLHQTHPGKGNPHIVKPAGPTDPTVGVLAARDEQGNFLGCLVNFACHCTVMGGTQFSADYPFYLAQTLRRVLGEQCLTVFLPGACGDVTQVDNLSLREREFGEAWAWRLGTALGGAVLQTIAQMEFHPDAPLQTRTAIVPLQRRTVPDGWLDEAKRLLSTDGLWSVERVYAREWLLLAEEVKRQPTVNAEVQVMGVGRSAFVAIPGELFCQFGWDIKRRSPFPTTFVVTCANGMVGYLPTPDAFKGGGYEVRLARSSQLMPDAGERLVAEALRLLATLTVPASPSRSPVTTPPWDVGASPPEWTGLAPTDCP
jgi:neutral ceramidase